MRYPAKLDPLQTWATWVVNLFHPIGSSFVFIILIAFSEALLSSKLAWVAIALSCTFIIPLTIIYGQRERFISDKNSQHFIPLLAGILCYTFGFIFLSALSAPALIQGLMFCYIVNTLVVTGISAWWKVSVYITQISTALITLCVQWGKGMLPLLSLILIVGVANVFLKKDTTVQVCVGALIGLVGTPCILQAVFHQGFYS